jgi:hypothetical protein
MAPTIVYLVDCPISHDEVSTVAKAKKLLSGGKRLGLSGRKAVLIGLKPDDHEKIRAAAELDRRPMTQYMIVASLAASEKKLGKEAK